MSKDEAIRFAQQIEADRREREKNRRAERQAWTAPEAERRFAEWLASVKAKFLADAEAEWDATRKPEVSFAAVGDALTRQRFPQKEFRAEQVAILEEVHAAYPLPIQEENKPQTGQLTAGGWRMQEIKQ